MSEYKGINLTKINGIQEINFQKTMTDSVSVRLAFEKFDTKDLEEVGKCIQDHVEKLFQTQIEDTEMFIICEMAKMFLEEKEKWKRVVERLEEQAEYFKDCTKYGNETEEQEERSYSTMMMYEVADLVDVLIEIVKEEGGLHELSS